VGDQLDRSLKHEVLFGVKENRSMLETIKQTKANGFGRMLSRNLLLNHARGKIEGNGRRRRNQLLEDLKETKLF
jgi:hypothetical protein